MKWKNQRFRIDFISDIFAYAVAVVGFSSSAPHVSWLFSLIFLLLLYISIMKDMTSHFQIPGFILNAVAVIVVFSALFRISAAQVVLPGIETVLLLLALKCLDKNKPRDHLQIYALSILLVAGSSLLSLDSTFFFYLVTLIFILGTANILLAYYRENPKIDFSATELSSIIGHSLFIPLLVLPLTLALFVLLPRTNYPFFSFLNRQSQAGSGFSDQVRLGKISQIQLDDSVVFRAAMERKEDRFLYWRGIVLDDFDGLSWRASPVAYESRQDQNLMGMTVRYTVYLEPAEYQTLFTLDKPIYVNFRNAIRSGNRTFRAREQLSKKTSYGGVSVLTDTEPAAAPERGRYLLLPPLSEEIRFLGATIGRGRKEAEIPAAIVAYLNRAPFRYSLKNLPQSPSPLEDFLLRNHSGNCEYFASSMAVILRSQGIPSRLIGGYRGGYYNELAEYYAIQQRHAHVWVEAYISGRGWVRYDPTPSIPQEDRGAAWRKLIFRLRMTMDIFDYYWNMHLIGYDLQQQYAMLLAVTRYLQMPGFSNINWQQAIPLLAPLPILLLIVALLFRTRGKPRRLWPAREDRMLKRFLALLERQGLHKKEFMGLEEFLTGIPAGALREQAEKFVNIFQGCYYRDVDFTEAEIRSMKSALDLLAKQVKQAKNGSLMV